MIPVILANHCPFCEKKTGFGSVCSDCKERHFLDGAVSCSPYAQKLILQMIHLWKYDGNTGMTEFLGNFAGRAIARMKRQARQKTAPMIERGITRADIISHDMIPALLADDDILLQSIPLHPKREKERGFNQAQELALCLERIFDKWRVIDILERVKKTTAQATLDPLDRAVNTRGAFALKNSVPPSPELRRAGRSRFSFPESKQDTASSTGEIKGKHIVLVDDVITTGNTADNCAELLKNAGAASVWALTIAYGHPVKK